MCREITVTGLREFLAELRVKVPVSRLAKWKTTVQLIALGILIVGDYGPDGFHIRLLGEIGIWVTAVLTLYTGRSEEHTSELQSLMRISYAVFCLTKKNSTSTQTIYH